MTEHRFTSYPTVSDKERDQSLQELEGEDWGEPTFPSYLVRTCHALRRKPLREFMVEDLRIMIGQNIGLDYLIPLALEHLQQNPLVAGDFFPGDLLARNSPSGLNAMLLNDGACVYCPSSSMSV